MNKQHLFVLGFLFAFAFGVPLTFATSPHNPEILPPQSQAFGKNLWRLERGLLAMGILAAN